MNVAGAFFCFCLLNHFGPSPVGTRGTVVSAGHVHEGVPSEEEQELENLGCNQVQVMNLGFVMNLRFVMNLFRRGYLLATVAPIRGEHTLPTTPCLIFFGRAYNLVEHGRILCGDLGIVCIDSVGGSASLRGQPSAMKHRGLVQGSQSRMGWVQQGLQLV